MKESIKKAVETYQCPGCVVGSDISCYASTCTVDCDKHVAGTLLSGIGRIFLGMPKGFCRIGAADKYKIYMFETLSSCDWYETKFNVPVWKYLDKHGNTLVRVYSPRVNIGALHIFLENCIDAVECIEITEEDIEEMD